MEPKSKECVMCAYEMSLKFSLYYDINKDEIIGFHNTNTLKTSDLAKSFMVIMIRGLHNLWKHQLDIFL